MTASGTGPRVPMMMAAARRSSRSHGVTRTQIGTGRKFHLLWLVALQGAHMNIMGTVIFALAMFFLKPGTTIVQVPLLLIVISGLLAAISGY